MLSWHCPIKKQLKKGDEKILNLAEANQTKAIIRETASRDMLEMAFTKQLQAFFLLAKRKKEKVLDKAF